jgi:hypothetical protein
MSELHSNRVDRIQDGESPLPLPQKSLISLLEAGSQYTENHLQRAAVHPSPHAFFSAIRELDAIQSRIGTRALEDLAEKIVRDHFGLTPQDIKIEARLLSPRQMPPPLDPPAPTKPISKDLIPELNKRLIINSLIQGAAHGVQYRFLFEDTKCAELHPSLATASRKLMALGDAAVWTIDERNFDHRQMSPAGFMKLDFATSPLTIKAQAIHFPVLVHEIAKGVVEVLALSGLPSDGKARNEVLSHADTPEKEAWGLTIGAELWRIISKEIPGSQSPRERSQIVRNIFALPAEKFIGLIEDISRNNTRDLKTLISKSGGL